MTTEQKRGFAGITLVLLLGVGVIGTIGWRQYAEPDPLRITLVARQMAFVVPDEPLVANPLLMLPPGRVAEIEFRNEDPGSLHDLCIRRLNLQTPLLKAGQSALLRFTMPSRGTLGYHCSRHPVMMRGELSVTASR